MSGKRLEVHVREEETLRQNVELRQEVSRLKSELRAAEAMNRMGARRKTDDDSSLTERVVFAGLGISRLGWLLFVVVNLVLFGAQLNVWPVLGWVVLVWMTVLVLWGAFTLVRWVWQGTSKARYYETRR